METVKIELSKEDHEFLLKTKNELETQDNRCTRDPFYIIKAVKKIFGLDEDYSSHFEFVSEDNETSFEENDVKGMIEFLTENEIDFEEEKFLKDPFEREEILESNGFRRIYYNEERYIVEEGTYFLTEQAALEHLKNNKHRLPESAYVYADSSWRNQQMNKIREIISKIK